MLASKVFLLMCLLLAMAARYHALEREPTCYFDSEDFKDILQRPTRKVEDLLFQMLQELHPASRSQVLEKPASLYNFTRNVLGLDFSTRDSVEFAAALRALGTSSAPVTSGAITINPADSIRRVQQEIEKAESGSNYDAMQLRTHLGYLLGFTISSANSSDVDAFLSSLTLRQIGTALGIIGQPYTIAFVVDDTGSMSEEIAHVQRLIRDFVTNGAASPSHYILTSFNDPGLGTARRYNTARPAELDQLLTDVNSLFAHGGGDCPELAMSGMMNALRRSSNQGHVIVLTDAGPKDSYLKTQVIALAKSMQVAIHFSFSLPLCSSGNDFYDIATETGGITIKSLESLDSLSDHLNRFFRTSVDQVNSPAPTVNEGSSRLTCKSLMVSSFVKTLALGITPSSTSAETRVRIYKPDNSTDKVFISALAFYTYNDPIPGGWRVCSKDHRLAVTKTSIVDLDITIRFLDYNPTTGKQFLSPTPPRNTDSRKVQVFVMSSKVNQLSNSSYLELSTSGDTLQVQLSRCSSSLQGEVELPTEPFKVIFKGRDKDGNPVNYRVEAQFQGQTTSGISCSPACENGGLCVTGPKCICPVKFGGNQCQASCAFKNMSPKLIRVITLRGTKGLLIIWELKEAKFCFYEGFKVAVVNLSLPPAAEGRIVTTAALGKHTRAFVVHGLSADTKYRIQLWTTKGADTRSAPLRHVVVMPSST